MYTRPENYEPDLARFAHAAETRRNRQRPAILLAEDQKFSRQLVASILGDEFDIHTAHNGLEALQLYENLAPDMTFLDINMPLLDGLTALTYISSIDPEAFVLILTASDAANDMDIANTCGAKGFITKPFNREKIESYLNQFKQEHKLAS